MKKQSFITILFIVLLSLVEANSFAHDIEVPNADGVTIYYYWINNTELAVSCQGSTYDSFHNEYSGDVVIPSSVEYNGNSYNVTSIGDHAFCYCSGLTSISIPNSVTSIGRSAFSDCSGLTSITIPNSVTNIGGSAFSYCSNLASVMINCSPDYPPNYDKNIFGECTALKSATFDCEIVKPILRGCTSLESVVMTEKVKTIDDSAFDNCNGLGSIDIPQTVTSIGEYAFYGCSGLTSIVVKCSPTTKGDIFVLCNNLKEVTFDCDKVTSLIRNCSFVEKVTLSEKVKDIKEGAFSGCSGLTSISVESGNTKFDSRDNCNAIIETSSNILVAGCKNTIFPNSVTSIGRSAFSGCSGLTSITIPNSVTSIGEMAFFGCSGLNSIIVDSENTKYDSRNNCNALIETETNTLIVGSNCSVIPNSVTSIGDWAFANCKGLTSITIPNSVTSIGAWAFSGTAWYNSQPDGVLYLDNCLLGYKHTKPSGDYQIIEGTRLLASSAFSNCSSLTSITIPNSVTSIEWNAFTDCSSLTSISIGDGVTSIGEMAFSGFGSLTNVTIGNSVTSIGERAFRGCTNLTSISISNSVTSIEKGAFSSCSGLTSITIPNSVTSIGSDAFNGCINLTSISIPNSVTSIGEWAFANCSGLTSVTIPNSVTSIGEYAFVFCSGVTTCTIGNGVTSIGVGAFSGCSGLTSISIPNSVTSIGDDAFFRCSGLTSISIGDGVTSIGDGAFFGCSSLTSITIPNSVTSIGVQAFSYCSNLTSVTMGYSVTRIDNDAFLGSNELTSLHISDIESWCKIDFVSYYSNPLFYAHHLFLDGVEIKDLVIPNSITSIGDAAFFGCSGLTSITIPNSVTSIGDRAFESCTGIKTIISLNNIPPTCEQLTQFGYINNYECIVWVPRESVNAYKGADGWKVFSDIRELSLGDVNLDGEVNKNDLNALVGFIMGENPEGFYEGLADLNDDNEVNAADVVKLVDILHVQDGLSTDWQPKFDSYQVITSLACTLNNNEDKPIQVTKCELYHDQSLVSYATSNVTLESGESKKCSFDDLASLSDNKGFYVVWHYTYNGESYTCRFNLPE